MLKIKDNFLHKTQKIADSFGKYFYLQNLKYTEYMYIRLFIYLVLLGKT